MSRSGTADTKELKSLTALRGIAAMAVVLTHFSATAQEHARVVIPSLVPHGYVAVDFFFVLSGFIMSYTYLADFHAHGMRAYGPFLAKRVARIVPLSWAVLVLLAIGGALSTALLGSNLVYPVVNPAYDFLTNALLLQGIGIGTDLNGPSWSISVEFMAYFVFPLVLLLIYGRRPVLIVTLLAALGGVLWIAFHLPRLGLGTQGARDDILRCFSEFTLGVAAHRLCKWKGSAFLARDDVTMGLSLTAILSLLARYDLPAVLVFPFLVVSYAQNRGRASRIVQAQPFYFLGVVSFSLYLLHSPFRDVELLLFQTLFPQKVGIVAALSFAFVGGCSIIPVAWLAYVTVERPGRKLVRLLLAGKRDANAIKPAHI
jgi:peptidoglycan/LPS O-acetylase OafA/YrhL